MILNKQNKQIQFTIEDENGEIRLNVPDIKIKKNNKGKYKFYFYFKAALTSLQIKPHSCIHSSKATSIRIFCKSY